MWTGWAWLKAETNRRVVSNVTEKAVERGASPTADETHSNINETKVQRIMTTNCWGVSQGAQKHERTCMGGKQIKRFRQNNRLQTRVETPGVLVCSLLGHLRGCALWAEK